MAAKITAAKIRKLLGTRPFDADGWSSILGMDCHMRLGVEAPVIGSTAVLMRLSELTASTAGVDRGYYQAWTRRQDIFIETEFECATASHITISVPCAIVVRSLGGLIRDIRIYSDRELTGSARSAWEERGRTGGKGKRLT